MSENRPANINGQDTIQFNISRMLENKGDEALQTMYLGRLTAEVISHLQYPPLQQSPSFISDALNLLEQQKGTPVVDRTKGMIRLVAISEKQIQIGQRPLFRECKGHDTVEVLTGQSPLALHEGEASIPAVNLWVNLTGNLTFNNPHNEYSGLGSTEDQVEKSFSHLNGVFGEDGTEEAQEIVGAGNLLRLLTLQYVNDEAYRTVSRSYLHQTALRYAKLLPSENDFEMETELSPEQITQLKIEGLIATVWDSETLMRRIDITSRGLQILSRLKQS